jgi:hypothetical protein
MELVLHAASVHVHPASRARHERVRAILDAAGAAYTVSVSTLEAPRETVVDAVDGAELPRLAVRRPALDIVFASYDNIVEWNDAGTLAAHLHETTAHAKATDKEIFKENMRMRAQIARLEAELRSARERNSGRECREALEAREAREALEAREARESREAQPERPSDLRAAAAEAIATSEAAEREVDAARAREAKLRSALRSLVHMVPTLMQIAGVLAE